MLNSIRNFTKSFWAKILLIIIIIPFVFWGMGSVFRGGGQNIVAKINNNNISTNDFMEYVDSLNINPKIIRENINNSIVEQLLSGLINKTTLLLQSKDLDLVLSDNILSEIIKKDEKFFDKNNQFSRTKYEKFLLTNNISAPFYEKNLKNEVINKLLFNYVSGGTFPPTFLVKNIYNYQNKKLTVKAINLNTFYKKEQDFDETSIKNYIDDNRDNLKENFISIRFVSINPLSLVDAKEFNNPFFEKIDEIENLILNAANFEEILKKYNLNAIPIKFINKDGINENGILQENIDQNLVNKIFELEFKKVKDINLLEYENEYALVIIDEIKNSIPNIVSKKFKEKIVKNLINKDIFEYNAKLMAKIKTNSLTESDFVQLVKASGKDIKNISINGIRDNNFFSTKSNNQIFNLHERNFTIVDEFEKNKTFLIWVKKMQKPSLDKTSDEYDKYYHETIIGLKNSIYSSFDNYINQKYKVEINYKTLERLKNYFR
jgi:peptidyl-prolyl cis-trans isomerase D